MYAIRSGRSRGLIWVCKNTTITHAFSKGEDLLREKLASLSDLRSIDIDIVAALTAYAAKREYTDARTERR
jgi:hypothetical protein